MGDYNTMSCKGICKRSRAKELGRGSLYTDIVANGVSRKSYYADIAISFLRHRVVFLPAREAPPRNLN